MHELYEFKSFVFCRINSRGAGVVVKEGVQRQRERENETPYTCLAMDVPG